MNELKAGIKVESEHKDVIRKLKKYIKLHHKVPKNNTIYKWIAQTHLKENKKYYQKLKKAKL